MGLRRSLISVVDGEGTGLKMLTVDRIKNCTEVLGPGKRFAVWFHGCRRNCHGCIAAEMNASSDYECYTPEQLLERVRNVSEVEGITVSGGEPFDQPREELEFFLHGVVSHGLNVMAYTGYLREELENDVQAQRLLRHVDILIDGPYRESEDHGELWRGSGNQRVHFLTDRYRDLEGSVMKRKGRPLEVELGTDRSFAFSGVPPRGFREKLRSALAERQMELNW